MDDGDSLWLRESKNTINTDFGTTEGHVPPFFLWKTPKTRPFGSFRNHEDQHDDDDSDDDPDACVSLHSRVHQVPPGTVPPGIRCLSTDNSVTNWD